MSTPDVNPNAIPLESATFNGMDLTEAEAALHAQDLSTVDPNAPAPAAVETPVEEPAPAAATVVEPAPAPAAAPVAAPPAPLFAEAPVASRDFAKDAADLRAKFDAGEVTTEEFVEQQHAITVEQARYEAQLTIYQAEQRRTAATVDAAKAEADKAWNAAAVQWERENADFIANPLRQSAMAQAIAAVDKETGGTLAPSDLLSRAAAVAFEAFGWQGGSAKTTVAQAVADRAAPARTLPTNLGAAPSAGAEDLRGNETFAALDRLPVDELEDALARMPAAQREAYLADAPGARTNARGSD